MPVAGDRIPDEQVMVMDDDGLRHTRSADLLNRGTVLLVGVPGAFTPVCNDHHFPDLVEHAEELRGRGVESIVVTAVNDAFVLDAWKKSVGAGDGFTLMADPDGSFAAAMGLSVDISSFGLGHRSQRYAALCQDGVLQTIDVEDQPTDHEVTSAASIMSRLQRTS